MTEKAQREMYFIIEANTMDPDQTAPLRSSLIRVHSNISNVCRKIHQQMPKQTTFAVNGRTKVNKTSIWRLQFNRFKVPNEVHIGFCIFLFIYHK